MNMRERETSGNFIRNLQTMLRSLASVEQTLETVIPDGIYGAETQRAVTSFQRAYDLPQTGVADLITWERIVEAYDLHRIENGPSAALLLRLQPGQIILPGEENLHMYAINGMLQALSACYDSMPTAESGGIHTDSSVNAVQWVQVRSDLEATGQIDRHTWRMIAALYRATMGDGTGKRG